MPTPLQSVVIAAMGAGLVAGLWAVDDGIIAPSPFQATDVAIAFVGTAVAMVFVVGLQMVRRNASVSRWAMTFFLAASTWFAALGASAMIIAAMRGRVAPAAPMLLAVGTGGLIGLAVCRRMFVKRFRGTL